jgi:hypothetical protein
LEATVLVVVMLIPYSLQIVDECKTSLQLYLVKERLDFAPESPYNTRVGFDKECK